MIDLNNRWSNAIGFFLCHELLMAGYYFQFVEGMEPCPLCIFQRVSFMAVGFVFLLGLLHQKALYQKIVNIFGFLAAISGVGLASRHLYLQGLPASEVPECGPGLEYMMQLFSFFDVLKKVMTGSGECAEVSWQFLGLSMPAWALVWFLGFAAVFAWRFFTVQNDEKPF